MVNGLFSTEIEDKSLTKARVNKLMDFILSISPEKDLNSVRRRCGMVFQFPALLDSLTVYENLALGLRAHAVGANEIRELRVADRRDVAPLIDVIA